MTRVKYKTITEGAGAGALESVKNVTLADGKIVKIVLDPNTFQFVIFNANMTQVTGNILKSGSGKHLTAAKRAARVALVELGAALGTEKRSSTKKILAQATAAATTETTPALENTGS